MFCGHSICPFLSSKRGFNAFDFFPFKSIFWLIIFNDLFTLCIVCLNIKIQFCIYFFLLLFISLNSLMLFWWSNLRSADWPMVCQLFVLCWINKVWLKWRTTAFVCLFLFPVCKQHKLKIRSWNSSGSSVSLMLTENIWGNICSHRRADWLLKQMCRFTEAHSDENMNSHLWERWTAVWTRA